MKIKWLLFFVVLVLGCSESIEVEVPVTQSYSCAYCVSETNSQYHYYSTKEDANIRICTDCIVETFDLILGRK